MTVRRTILGVILLAVLVVAGLWWRAVATARQLLRVDAPASIAEKSGGVYQVAVGRVRFNPASRRVTVDTIHVTTDSAANAARPRPRATLHLSFQECTISGVHPIKLIFRRGLIADSFGCASVSATVDVPRGGPDSAGPSDDAERAFYALQQGLRLPASAPQVRIAGIDFPQIALDFRLQRARGGATRLMLEHLRWRMTDFLIDPRDSTAAARPLFSDTVEIAAANFVGQLDSVTAVRVEGLRLSLSDSTLEIRGVNFEPSQSDSAFARSHPYRRTLVRTATSRIAVNGLDVGVLLLRQGVRARRVQLDSLRMDVFSDQRRPKNPRRPPRLTPQRWIAGIERGISVDSIVIPGGEIVYREHRARHPKPGEMTFARLHAVATNVRHIVGRRRAVDPLILNTTAYLQNQGKLEAQFVVPLDARGFTMRLRGTLGPMPAASLNAFIEETFPLRLDKGRIEGITFSATVTNGVAQGTVTPLYKHLAVEVTGEGSKGILSTGGVIGDAARGVATFVGNLTELRSDNPEDGETAPRVGTINHTFTSDQSLPTFLWKSIRSGLLAVVRK